ncbi:MAG: protease complex subunit PrcB family protein [Pyrinomonadaceae bacterium]|nr:protease complex subunit PrcB family protein [Pyrinomonadaceae bacterium]
MLSVKAGLIAVLLVSFALNGASACDSQKKGEVKSANQQAKAGAQPNSNQQERVEAKGDLKRLAEGQHSPVSNAFIAVARDAETYGALRKLVSNLPEQSQDFFKSNLVVAAFLGERRTGGYSVRFSQAGNGALRVDENMPPKGSMTIQVITYPFAVVAVPISERESLALDVGRTWRSMIRNYQVKDGSFTMSGGIAGRSQTFGITGGIGVMREGELATFFFNLQSKDASKPREMKDIASGVVQASGQVKIPYLNAGSFVDMPADALRATGLFAENESKLSLNFESVPGRIADGFNGRGSLNAEASMPAPRKNNSSAKDAPQ